MRLINTFATSSFFLITAPIGNLVPSSTTVKQYSASPYVITFFPLLSLPFLRYTGPIRSACHFTILSVILIDGEPLNGFFVDSPFTHPLQKGSSLSSLTFSLSQFRTAFDSFTLFVPDTAKWPN